MAQRSIPSNGQRVTFSVLRTAVWAADADTEPPLPQMPAMLRRRAGRMERLACHAAYEALDGETGVPMVFCSRYGETVRSVELLETLASGASLSPASFSLSVHNSAAGLFSIARHDRANAIALAAGEESAAWGVIEACGLMADGAARVLVVYADCPLPPVLEAYADTEAAAFAWGALLAVAGGQEFALEWQPAAPASEPERRVPAGLEVLRFLEGRSAALVHVAGARQWNWLRGV